MPTVTRKKPPPNKRLTALKRAIRRFETAAINESWRGSMNPESWDEISQEYRDAKRAVYKLAEEVCRGA